MFKKFIRRIVLAKNKEDAFNNVFYGTKYDENGNITVWGVDIAFQHNKISWEEHQLLLALIEKMAE